MLVARWCTTSRRISWFVYSEGMAKNCCTAKNRQLPSPSTGTKCLPTLATALSTTLYWLLVSRPNCSHVQLGASDPGKTSAVGGSGGNACSGWSACVEADG